MKNILFWKNETSDQSVAELKEASIPHLIPFVQGEPGKPYPCMIVLPGAGANSAPSGLNGRDFKKEQNDEI